VIFFRFGSDPLRTSREEFNGTTGLRGEGRWHILGTPIVYAANSEPLALLEKLVHRKATAPLAYPLYLANIPDELIEELAEEDYPQDWRSIYPPDSTRALGNSWLESSAAVGLLVPSVLISGIHGSHVKNCLVNPLHPEFHQVKLSGPIAFAVDPRLPSGVYP
jgi:RES domain-containing protein